jgi:hypothetical protein
VNTVEQWRPVRDFEGIYEVSDLGRVKSLARLDALGRPWPERIMGHEVKSNGRHRVKLCGPGRTERRHVHRMVLEAFVGRCPEGLEACHWNDDPSDNRLTNLRWDTQVANSRDAVRNRTHSMSRKTQCPSGHPYDAENTRWTKRGTRQCKTCTREQQRAAYQARTTKAA